MRSPIFGKPVLAAFSLSLFVLVVSTPPARALGGFGVTNIPLGKDFAVLAALPGVQPLTGDFNGDGLDDLALTGGANWSSVPVAFSQGDGTFDVQNLTIDHNFGPAAATPGARALVGDLNGDGRADIALTGVVGWTTVAVAFSNGDGSFSVTNDGTTFAYWASNPNGNLKVADFNGDGKADLATVIANVSSPVVAVAFSNGDGTFNSQTTTTAFAVLACTSGATLLQGDFNDDGKTDLALTGGVNWQSIPVAFSNGDGSFQDTNYQVDGFPGYAASSGARIFTGDFNHDHKTDIGVTGVQSWVTIPLALSNGDGHFTKTNNAVPTFPGLAALPGIGVKLLVGDFNADGNTDLALTGPGTWKSVVMAFSDGNAGFVPTNEMILDIWAWTGLTTPLLGDYNDDGRLDFALTGVSGWQTVPIAFSLSRNLPN